jgi:hypothetical protein
MISCVSMDVDLYRLKGDPMTQRANNAGRQASLDEKKERAAGRQQNDPARAAIKDQFEDQPAKGQTGGASGQNKTSRPSKRGSRG